jgi:hypothetical protein
MSNVTHDAGVIMALVERFNSQRLPRALELKTRVDAGATLNDFDLHFLQDVMEDAKRIAPLVDRHPEYQELVARAAHLYREITEKALENEKNAG